MNKSKAKFSMKGIWAFLIVLFSMPLGHALMVASEHLFSGDKIFTVAFVMGLIGVLITLWGYVSKGHTQQTLLGFIGGILFWTGWIEFAYVYYARRYGIPPLMDGSEVVTKPEYLIMPSSIGFWAMMMIGYILNSRTGCNLLNWIQRHILRQSRKQSFRPAIHNVAVVTFMELNAILWTCYLLLLFVYDEAFLGDRHPVTYIVAFVSLIWSLYLFAKLIRIHNIGVAIRYAIPTVIIFWNVVEIMGRWNLFKEIWVHPFEHTLEMVLILVSFVIFVGILYYTDWKAARQKEKEKIQ